ncbi:MAG: radical SAM protein [Spirochaetaceae bacterium]
MKAVVVTPSIFDFYFTPGRATALGAIAVQKQLLKYGINAPIYNLPLLNARGKSIPLPDHLNYLKPYIIPGEKGPISFFKNYKRFGPTVEDSAKLILETNPDIVYISLFAWVYASNTIDLARQIKLENSSVKLVIGGAGVAVLPEYFNNSNLFDYVVRTEAGQGLPPFVDLSDVREINRENPEPIISFNTDKKGKQWLSIALSRGCPLKCQFCSNHLTQGRKFRCTPVIELLEELKKITFSSSEPIHMNIEDDNLLINKDYFSSVLKTIKLQIPHVTFSIDNGLDYTYLNTEYVNFLIDIGFTSFTLSLGSADLETLKQQKRPANLEKLELIIDFIIKRKIKVSTFLICGLPEDTPESILVSLRYIHKLPTLTNISMFYVVPGLPKFQDKQYFLDLHPSLCCGSVAYPHAGSLTTKQMVTVFRLARLSNYIKTEPKIDLDLLGLFKDIKNLDEDLIKGFITSI